MPSTTQRAQKSAASKAARPAAQAFRPVAVGPAFPFARPSTLPSVRPGPSFTPTPSAGVLRPAAPQPALLPSNHNLLRPFPHSAPASAGQPLESPTRRRFESAFGASLSSVRVHIGPLAASSARAAEARAYTAGDHIVFNAGHYSPGTAGGQRLLAHEITHVLQQRLPDAAPAGPGASASPHAGPSEQQARRAADALAWGRLAPDYSRVAAGARPHPEPLPAPQLPSLTPADAALQRVQLTYDDGPDSAGNTRTVLSELNAAGARATFYLVGKRVAQGDNWRIVFDIAAAGHWLGNHAFEWNDKADEHIFLHGTAQERAEKILETEWAIRDALIRGRDAARQRKAWDAIPAPARTYIEDVIAHGTGRFRTPGFKSHTIHEGKWPTFDGANTTAGIDSANQVLAATGLRPLARTTDGFLGEEGVNVDPKDWQRGRTRQEIESGVHDKLSSNTDSILLHSRVAATAQATPAIVSDIQKRKFSFDPTPQGTLGAVTPSAGFAGLSTISDPPTHSEVVAARSYLRDHRDQFGPAVSGHMAVRIFQLAQKAGAAEAADFAAEIKAGKVKTADGPIPLANWFNASEDWRLFSTFFENWLTNAPFPRITGVTQ